MAAPLATAIRQASCHAASTTDRHLQLPISVTAAFRDLGLLVVKASVDGTSGSEAADEFFVTQGDGEKLGDHLVESVEKAINGLLGGQKLGKRPLVGATKASSKNKALLYSLLDTYIQNDVLSIEESIVSHVEYTLARNRYNFDDLEAYQATAYSLRDRLIQAWNDTQQYFKDFDPKRVYYMSMEFLMGRSLTNALNNLAVVNQYTEALREMGYNLEELVEQERDAALGNGGLGRLAACFLDSMASLNLPAWGYGLRYQYGMFRQLLVDGFQHEQPDYWLNFGNPWEIERLNVGYSIKFYGHVSVQEEGGRQVFKWVPGESVSAVAYDNPIPGFQTNNTINLRLWAAKPDREFDLQAFNTGDYVQAILARQRAETLSSVLYPDDRTYQGKELRLKQQHFFVSATMQDVIRRYRETHDDFEAFPDKVAFQLNDTHPSIAVPELMRLLMDEHSLGWTRAWEITSQVFAFTNHTVLPEALERWPISLVQKLLPRHMQIIYDINWRFLQQLREKVGEDLELMSRMSIIEEGERGEKLVRMAYLAVVASHTVNGVAAIHSDIIRNSVFKDFADLWPHKFQNKTNGVTPRRWLAFCNPPLRALISRTLGTESWINNLTELTALREHADNPTFQEEWQEVKRTAKAAACRKITALTGTEVSSEAMLDIQVKRIHEYKRQLLNVLGIIHRYDALKKMSPEERSKVVPRVCVIGGKAAPGYEQAKRIIKLITAVGVTINGDKETSDMLKVVFVPDYNVSLAEVLIPGSDVSQHISTAGTEASGTGNMKFAMNGSLIIGTMDGANVEIADEIGEDNMFIFGHRAHEIADLRKQRASLKPDPRFLHVLDLIRQGTFGWEDFFEPLVESITTGGDFYLLANDFPSYIAVQEEVDRAFQDKARWTRMSINSVAGCGWFSSDRTISEYAKEIWNVEPCIVPAP
ncbi:hypothetical protein WJX73_005816 [Symbiochloris irregularis]|uniref:Alpha-1,4 glucan phosphorylase n=1 Tax=Symbiochloris irregularis TaxID=706552 RepID=A0AAW1P282_9CHLO